VSYTLIGRPGDRAADCVYRLERGLAAGRHREESAVMFESFKNLIATVGSADKHPSGFDDEDFRVAAAALLVHTAAIDGAISQAERDKLHDVIKDHFNLDDTATDRLVAEATQADQQAIDLYRFTARLNRSLDEKGRARVVEMMWQIVYADGGVGEFEDNLVWRAADLLGISSQERIALRERIAGEGADKNLADKT
jgi:uncharacterized tellurite resistance protein B-like protein